MIPILLLISAYAMAAWLIHSCVKTCGDGEFSIWSIIGTLLCARFASRGVLWIASGAEPFTKLGIGFVVYAAVVAIALATIGRVPWVRSIAWSVGITIMMFVVAFVSIAYLSTGGKSGAGVP